MSVAVPILVGFAILLVAAFVFYGKITAWIQKRRDLRIERKQARIKQDQAVKDWLLKVSSTDPNDVVDAGGPPSEYRDVFKVDVEAALARQNDVRDQLDDEQAERTAREFREQQALEQLEQARTEPDIVERFDHLYNLLEGTWKFTLSMGIQSDVANLSRENSTWALTELQTIAPQMIAQRLEQARNGSEEDFRIIQEYLANDETRKLFIDVEYPLDWNSLVAQHVKTPSLGEFHLEETDGPFVGETRALAAEATQEDSLVKAKIVLAWCDADSDYRNEVGEILLVELAKLVARHHVMNDRSTAI